MIIIIGKGLSQVYIYEHGSKYSVGTITMHGGVIGLLRGCILAMGTVQLAIFVHG